MICGRFMHRLPRPRETWLDRRIEPVLEALSRFYARSLDWALGHRWLMLMTTFIVLALTVMTFIVLPKGLIPSGDGNAADRARRAPTPDISFETIRDLQRRVTDIVLDDPDVVSVGASIGGNSRLGRQQSAAAST